MNLSFYLQDTEENNSTDELPLSVEDAKPTKVCVYCVYCVYCVLCIVCFLRIVCIVCIVLCIVLRCVL